MFKEEEEEAEEVGGGVVFIPRVWRRTKQFAPASLSELIDKYRLENTKLSWLVLVSITTQYRRCESDLTRGG